MGKSLKHQMIYAIDCCFKEGMDKNSAKADGTFRYHDKVYSYSDRENLRDFANNFAKYLREQGVKMVRDIKPEQLQDFLNKKADAGAQRSTCGAYRSWAEKIGNLCNKVYKSNLDFSDCKIPQHAQTHNLRTIKFERNDFDKMINDIEKRLEKGHMKNTETLDALKLARHFGLRADEATHLKHKMFDFEKGVLHICDNIAKGGKDRDIPMSEEGRRIAKEITERKYDGDRNARLFTLKTDSLNKYLSRAEEKSGIREKYQNAKTGIHAIRKMWATEQYEKYLKQNMSKGPEGTAWQKVCQELGHSGNRKELFKVYIKNS